MNQSEKHLSAQEIHKFQHDLKWVLDQCDNMITKIAEHGHENAENLRSKASSEDQTPIDSPLN